MDIIAQKKMLIRIVVFLTVLNIVSIGFFVCKDVIFRPRKPLQCKVQKDASTILQKELDLSQQQFEQVRNLRTKYFEKEKSIEHAIRQERDSMNTSMFNKNTDEELVKSLARKVADNEFSMEMMRFEQAKEFKTICNQTQLEKFGVMVKEIRDYFKPDKPNDAPQK